MTTTPDDSSASLVKTIEERNTDIRFRMSLVIDLHGGDGTSAFMSTKSVEEMTNVLGEQCWELGRDDVLRQLVNPKLSNKQRLEKLKALAEEHWDEPIVLSEPVAEKVVIGFRVTECLEKGEKSKFYAIPADDCEEGFWWTDSRLLSLLRTHEEAQDLLKKVTSCGDTAKIVAVTRKQKKEA